MNLDLGIVVGLLGVFLALLVQTVAIVWFFSRLNSRVEVLESKAKEDQTAGRSDRLLKVEFLLEILQQSTDSQTLKLDEISKRMATAEAERHVIAQNLKDLNHEGT